MCTSEGNDWRARLRIAIARSYKKERAIARDAGIAPATLSRIKNGSAQPSFDAIVRIARATDVRVGWLLEEHGFEFTVAETQAILTAGLVLLHVFSRPPCWRENERPRWGGGP